MKKASLVTCLLFMMLFVLGQPSSLKLSSKDSLTASPENPFITNILFISNTSLDSMPISVKIYQPLGWSYFGDTAQKLVIGGGQQISLPLTYQRTVKSLASWTEARIEVINRLEKQSISFSIKSLPVFRAMVTCGSNILFANAQETKDLKLNVTNTGNASDWYLVQVLCPLLDRISFSFSLEPQETKKMSIPLKFSKENWDQLKESTALFVVTSKNGFNITKSITINRIATLIKENPSSYEQLELSAETGILINGDKTTYYQSATGKSLLKNSGKIDFTYKTRQYGSNNNLYNDVFAVSYTAPSTKLVIGQMYDARFFYGNGRGYYLEQKYLTSGARVFASGIWGDKNYQNTGNLWSVGTSYGLKKLQFRNELLYNIYQGLNSYLVNNEVSLKETRTLGASISIAVGYDQTQSRGQSIVGRSIGYSFRYLIKNVLVNSKVIESDNKIPGIIRGVKNQTHLISYSFKTFSVGAFLSETKTPFNLFRDTVFNSDALLVNNKRSGFSLSAKTKHTSVGLSLGKMHGLASATGLEQYDFSEIFLSSFYKDFSMSGNSIIGRNKDILYNGKTTFYTTSSLRVNARFLGLSCLYTSIPKLNDTVKQVDHYVQTLNIAPSITIGFKNFRADLAYSISKTLLDKSLTSTINSIINYTNRRKQLELNLTSYIPIKKSAVQNLGASSLYVSLTVKKTFYAPLVFSKPYRSITLRFFKDINANNVKDDGEEFVSDLPVRINDALLISDNSGRVQYLHVRKGFYKVDLSQTPRGWIPPMENSIIFNLGQDYKKDIPLVKSHVIFGMVRVHKDSLSNIQISPQGLKIIAQDTSGRTFLTITNETGSFFINVPPGRYNVSLNPEAFDNNIKPDQFSYYLDINQSDQEVLFNIRQQRRRIRFLNQ